MDWSKTRAAGPGGGGDPREQTFGARGIGGRGAADRNAIGYALNPQLAAEAAAAEAAEAAKRKAQQDATGSSTSAPVSPTRQHGKGRARSPVVVPTKIIPKVRQHYNATPSLRGDLLNIGTQ